MKKLKKIGVLLTGAGGFIAGSRSGRKPYESLEKRLQKLAKRPEVENAKDTVKEKVGSVVDIATKKAEEIKTSVEASDSSSSD